MKVFVTGAAGYIGSVVTEQLINTGHSVVAYDNLKSGHRAAVHPEADFIQGDILEEKALYRAIQGCDAVMHMASEIVVSESYRDPGLHFRTNLCGGIELLEAMREADITKIVFSSSAAVYGDPSLVTPEGSNNDSRLSKAPGPAPSTQPTTLEGSQSIRLLTENESTNPISPYGESKLQFERVLSWYGEIHHFKHVSLRYFNACGATERNGEHRPIETHLIPILLDVAEGKKPSIKLFGDDYPTRDGTCVRDYVHVSDIAKAHVLVLEALDQIGEGVFNLGSSQGCTNREVIQAAEKVSGKQIAVDIVPRRQGDPAVLVASYEKIHRELGWKPGITKIIDMVMSAWQWRQTHPRGYAT